MASLIERCGHVTRKAIPIGLQAPRLARNEHFFLFSKCKQIMLGTDRILCLSRLNSVLSRASRYSDSDPEKYSDWDSRKQKIHPIHWKFLAFLKVYLSR